MFNHPLHENKRSAEVDIYRVVEFFQCNIPDLGHALAIAGVGDEDIWSLSVLLIDFLEHGFDLFC